MFLTKKAEPLIVSFQSYTLEFSKERPYCLVKDNKGKLWMKLYLGAGVNLDGESDMVEKVVSIKLKKTNITQVVVTLKTSLLNSLNIIFTCHKNHFLVRFKIKGIGKIGDVKLFGGYDSSSSFGSTFLSSEALFETIFNSVPTTEEKYILPTNSVMHLGATGSSLPGQGHWFFTPPPLFFAYHLKDIKDQAKLENIKNWLGVGFLPKKGAHNFSSLRYSGSQNAFYYKLSYDGKTSINGEFSFPEIIFMFNQKNPYKGLANYSDYYKKHYMRKKKVKNYNWWKNNIFCGWGAQVMLETPEIKAQELATQKNYDTFLADLKNQGIVPGTITIDDKWQKEYGTNWSDSEKWPDLKNWIKERHKEGSHVLLWFKAWDPEGLNEDECILDNSGNKIAADPTNPKYEKRLRESVRQILGKEGYDADGFKIDFTGRTPIGPRLSCHGKEWGIELLHKLLFILYDEAKKTKKDALIVTHTPNPYFSDVTDMIRLNDINCEYPVVKQMVHRARIAKAVCPTKLIDTDNWPMPDKKQWRDYLKIQSSLGVPALYYTSGVNKKNIFTKEDYRLINKVWKDSHTESEVIY